MADTGDLASRVAMVTGGGSGIGRGIALAFGAAGSHVVDGGFERMLMSLVPREGYETPAGKPA